MTNVFCIPGMFRSGGAMFAEAVRLAGVEFGADESLRPPVANFNEHGFFEHQTLAEMQERLLESLGRSWASSEPLPTGWQDSPVVKSWQCDMQGLAAWEFASFETWGWRSPISSLLLPAWKEIAEEAGFSLHILVPLRNPLDVARSLQRVCGIPERQGLRLWLYYTLAILEATKGLPHRIFSYDACLENPEVGCRRLVEFLGFPATDERLARMLPAIRKESRRQQPATLAELREVAGTEVAGLYEHCLATATSNTAGQPPLTLADYARMAKLFDFGRSDAGPTWLFTSLVQESRPDPLAVKLLFHTQDGRVDETYVLPAGYAANIALAVSLALGGISVRCRIESVEADGLSRSFACLNPVGQQDGWDLFAPGTSPLYRLDGRFAAGMRLRIRGQFELVPEPPALEFQTP